MRFAYFIWKNLVRNRRRSILTASSLAVSIFLFIPLMSFAQFQQMVSQLTPRNILICHNRASLRYHLPAFYRQKLLAMPHVDAVSGWSSPDVVFRDSSDQILLAA